MARNIDRELRAALAHVAEPIKTEIWGCWRLVKAQQATSGRSDLDGADFVEIEQLTGKLPQVHRTRIRAVLGMTKADHG